MLTVIHPRVMPGTEAAVRERWRGCARLVIGLLLWATTLLLVTSAADPESRQIGGAACDASLLSWY